MKSSYRTQVWTGANYLDWSWLDLDSNHRKTGNCKEISKDYEKFIGGTFSLPLRNKMIVPEQTTVPG